MCIALCHVAPFICKGLHDVMPMLLQIQPTVSSQAVKHL